MSFAWCECELSICWPNFIQFWAFYEDSPDDRNVSLVLFGPFISKLMGASSMGFPEDTVGCKRSISNLNRVTSAISQLEDVKLQHVRP